jgi:putative membrane protein
MTIKQILTAAALAALSGGAAQAQMTMPMPSPGITSVDRTFLIADAQGSVSDLAHGEAAVERASTNELRQYAIQIVEDHSRLNMQLYQLAQKKGVALPVVMEDKDRDELQTLVQKQGTDFDRSFLQDEIRINTQDVKDGDKELSITQDQDVRALVMQYRDTEAVMLARAQMYLSRMPRK